MAMLPDDRRNVARNGAIGAPRACERGDVRGDNLRKCRKRLEPPAPAPVLELAPVAGVGAQRIGAARPQAIDPGGLDFGDKFRSGSWRQIACRDKRVRRARDFRPPCPVADLPV